MKKIAFHTLGCKLNYAETSTLSRKFEQRGYCVTSLSKAPDIFVINTCSVTENADKKCRYVVRRVRKLVPNVYIVVVGCYAQLKPDAVAAIDGVNIVLGAREKFQIVDILEGLVEKQSTRTHVADIAKEQQFREAYSFGDRTRAFLKVQDGCDYSCSFCTIPKARGMSRSDSIPNLVSKAKQIARQGAKEIVLTGINIGDFGLVNGRRIENLMDLIVALDDVEQIERFRISSIEPNLLTDKIIKFVAQSKRFVPHFHIPLQSGCDKILKLMRRRYMRELYQNRVEEIKSLMPDACIGADVIVGFPQEDEIDFMETYSFLERLDFSYLHVFTYSERDHTIAIQMKGAVNIEERRRRAAMLQRLSDTKKKAFYQSCIGYVFDVLYEDDQQNGLMHGFTKNYIRVATPHHTVLANTIRRTHLSRISEDIVVEGELSV